MIGEADEHGPMQLRLMSFTAGTNRMMWRAQGEAMSALYIMFARQVRYQSIMKPITCHPVY